MKTTQLAVLVILIGTSLYGQAKSAETPDTVSVARASLDEAIKKKDLTSAKANVEIVKSQGIERTVLDQLNSVGEYFYTRGKYEQALAWYRIAADEGHSIAQVNVGYIYLNGKGVTQSDEEAVKWFQRAANGGDPWGQSNLAFMYQHGRGGLQKSKVDAIRLYELGAQAGIGFAQARLDDLKQPEDPPIIAAIKNADIRAIQELHDVTTVDRDGVPPLLLAVRLGNREVVKLLLSLGAAPDYQDRTGDSPLLSAITLKRKDLVEDLLAAGANPRIAAENGATPLTLALVKRQPEIVSLLLAAGVDVNQRGVDGGTALHWAIPESNLPQNSEILSRIVEAGADIEAKEDEHGLTALMLSLDSPELIGSTRFLVSKGADVNTTDLLGHTPLMVAAIAGRLDAVRLLLEHGARVNATNKAGMTPLMFATQEEKSDVVRELVSAGADIELKDHNGHSALTRAVWNDTTELLRFFQLKLKGKDFAAMKRREQLNLRLIEAIRSAASPSAVSKLLDAGANIESKTPDGITILQMAVTTGAPSLETLLRRGADPNARSAGGVTALMLAATFGRTETVRHLLREHANVNDTDEEGRTALMYALVTSNRFEQEEVVRTLVGAGANVNAAATDALNAVRIACAHQRWDLVRLLLSAGAKESQNSCALHAASATGAANDIQALIEAGADINAQLEGSQTTALHLAARLGHAQAVRTLLLKGANPNLAESDGSTALIRAAEAGHTEVIQALIAANAALNERRQPHGFDDGGTALHIAVDAGRTDAAIMLIEAGADINAVDGRDETPLMDAAWNVDLPLTTALLARGARVDLKDASHWTALMNAVVTSMGETSDQLAVLDMLVKAGSDLEATNNSGETPLVLAARENHVAVFRRLLELGADLAGVKGATAITNASKQNSLELVKLLLERKAELDRSGSDRTFAIPAVAIGETEDESIALALISAGADIEGLNQGGNSPLLIAALYGRERVVEALLKAGVPVDDSNESGDTPLLWAAEFGHEDAARLLLSAGANVEHRDSEGRTPLLAAAGGEREPNAACIEILLKAGAALNAVDNDGNSALHLAAARGYSKNAVVLLKKGASVDARNKVGRTPLFNAVLARGPHYANPDDGLQVIRALVKYGANLNTGDADGVTPLMEAARHGHVDMVRALIFLGANVNARTASGSTALLEVLNAHDEEPASLDPIPRLTVEGQIEIARLLIKHGAKPDVATPDGVTPLMRTSFNGHAELTKVLLESGAKVDAQNEEGWTALMFAAGQGESEIVKLLLRARARHDLKNTDGEDAASLALANGHQETADLLRPAKK